MFRKTKKIISVFMLVALILSVLPPGQTAMAAPEAPGVTTASNGVIGQVLDEVQTGDRVKWVEIARNGSYSLIVRTSYLNVHQTPGYRDDPVRQYSAWEDGETMGYRSSLVHNRINAWFKNTAKEPTDSLPSGARVRKFTMKNNANERLGTASLSDGFSTPSATQNGNADDIAFALSFSEAASFVSNSYYTGGSNPVQGSSDIAKANWGKMNVPAPGTTSDDKARGVWLRSPGASGTMSALLNDKDNNRGRVYQMSKDANMSKEYGYIYPALWVNQDIFKNTLTYNANGGSGGNLSSQVGDYKTNITIHSNPATRAGYKFLGWATTASATNPQYQSGDQINMNNDITLYAVWRVEYTITYNANGGTGAPQQQTVPAGDAKLSYTTPTRSGYAFVGWSENIAATSAQYEAGGSITMSKNVTLYAVWSQIFYTITYDANGGQGAPQVQTVPPGNTTLSATVPTRTEYTFLGWSTIKTATAAQFSAGGTTNVTGNVTLYAIWTQSAYTITYEANGGTGAPAQQTVIVGSATLSSEKPTRNEYSFMGWADNKSATDKQYDADGMINISNNYTL